MSENIPGSVHISDYLGHTPLTTTTDPNYLTVDDDILPPSSEPPVPGAPTNTPPTPATLDTYISTQLTSDPSLGTTIDPQSNQAKQIYQDLLTQGVITTGMTQDQMTQAIHRYFTHQLHGSNTPISQLVNIEASVIGQGLLQKGCSMTDVRSRVQIATGTTVFGDADIRVVYTNEQGQKQGFALYESTSGYLLNEALYSQLTLTSIPPSSLPPALTTAPPPLSPELTTAPPPILTTPPPVYSSGGGSGGMFDGLIEGADGLDGTESEIDRFNRMSEPPPVKPLPPGDPDYKIVSGYRGRSTYQVKDDKGNWKTVTKAEYDQRKAAYQAKVTKYNVDLAQYNKDKAKYDANGPHYLIENGDGFIYPDIEKMTQDMAAIMAKLQKLACLVSVANMVAKLIEKISNKLTGEEQTEAQKKTQQARDKVSEKLQNYVNQVNQMMMTQVQLFLQNIFAQDQALLKSKNNDIEAAHSGFWNQMLNLFGAGQDDINKVSEMKTVAEKFEAIMEMILKRVKQAFLNLYAFDMDSLDPDSRSMLESRYNMIKHNLDSILSGDLFQKDSDPKDANGKPIDPRYNNGDYVKFRDDKMLEAFQAMDLMNNIIRGFFIAKDTQIQAREMAAESLERSAGDKSGSVGASKLSKLSASMFEQKVGVASFLLQQVNQAAQAVVSAKNIVNSLKVQLEKLSDPGYRALKALSFFTMIITVIVSAILMFTPAAPAAMAVMMIGMGLSAIFTLAANAIQLGIEWNKPQMADMNRSFIDPDKLEEILDKLYGSNTSTAGETKEEQLLREAQQRERALIKKLYMLRTITSDPSTSGMIDVGGGRYFADYGMVAEVESEINRIQEQQRFVYLMAKMKADMIRTAAAEMSGEGKKFEASSFGDAIVNSHFAVVSATISVFKFILEQVEWANNLNVQIQEKRNRGITDLIFNTLFALIPLVGQALGNFFSELAAFYMDYSANRIDLDRLVTRSTWLNGDQAEIDRLRASNDESDQEKALLMDALRKRHMVNTGGHNNFLGGDSTGLDYQYFNTVQSKLEKIALQRSMRVILTSILVDLKMAALSSIKGGGASLSVAQMAMSSASDTAGRANEASMTALNNIKQYQQKIAQASQMKFQAQQAFDKAIMSMVIMAAAAVVMVLSAFFPVLSILMIPAMAAAVFSNQISTAIYMAQANDAKEKMRQTAITLMENTQDEQEREIYEQAQMDAYHEYGCTALGFGGIYVNQGNMSLANFRLILLEVKRKAFMTAIEEDLQLRRDAAQDMGATPASGFTFDTFKDFASYKKQSSQVMLQNYFGSIQNYVDRETSLINLRREFVQGMIDQVIAVALMALGGGKSAPKPGTGSSGPSLGSSLKSGFARSIVAQLIANNLKNIIDMVIASIQVSLISSERQNVKNHTNDLRSQVVTGSVGLEEAIALAEISGEGSAIEKELNALIAELNKQLAEIVVNMMKSLLEKAKDSSSKLVKKDGSLVANVAAKDRVLNQEIAGIKKQLATLQPGDPNAAALIAKMGALEAQKFTQLSAAFKSGYAPAAQRLSSIATAIKFMALPTEGQIEGTVVSDAAMQGAAGVENFENAESDIQSKVADLSPKEAEDMAKELGITPLPGELPKTAIARVYSEQLSELKQISGKLEAQQTELNTAFTAAAKETNPVERAKLIETAQAKAAIAKATILDQATGNMSKMAHIHEVLMGTQSRGFIRKKIEGFKESVRGYGHKRNLREVVHNVRQNVAMAQLTDVMNSQSLPKDLSKQVMTSFLNTVGIKPDGNIDPNRTPGMIQKLTTMLNEMSHDGKETAEKVEGFRANLCASEDKGVQTLGALLMLTDSTLGSKYRTELMDRAFKQNPLPSSAKTVDQAKAQFLSLMVEASAFIPMEKNVALRVSKMLVRDNQSLLNMCAKPGVMSREKFASLMTHVENSLKRETETRERMDKHRREGVGRFWDVANDFRKANSGLDFVGNQLHKNTATLFRPLAVLKYRKLNHLTVIKGGVPPEISADVQAKTSAALTALNLQGAKPTPAQLQLLTQSVQEGLRGYDLAVDQSALQSRLTPCFANPTPASVSSAIQSTIDQTVQEAGMLRDLALAVEMDSTAPTGENSKISQLQKAYSGMLAHPSELVKATLNSSAGQMALSPGGEVRLARLNEAISALGGTTTDIIPEDEMAGFTEVAKTVSEKGILGETLDELRPAVRALNLTSDQKQAATATVGTLADIIQTLDSHNLAKSYTNASQSLDKLIQTITGNKTSHAGLIQDVLKDRTLREALSDSKKFEKLSESQQRKLEPLIAALSMMDTKAKEWTQSLLSVTGNEFDISSIAMPLTEAPPPPPLPSDDAKTTKEKNAKIESANIAKTNAITALNISVLPESLLQTIQARIDQRSGASGSVSLSQFQFTPAFSQAVANGNPITSVADIRAALTPASPAGAGSPPPSRLANLQALMKLSDPELDRLVDIAVNEDGITPPLLKPTNEENKAINELRKTFFAEIRLSKRMQSVLSLSKPAPNETQEGQTERLAKQREAVNALQLDIVGLSQEPLFLMMVSKLDKGQIGTLMSAIQTASPTSEDLLKKIQQVSDDVASLQILTDATELQSSLSSNPIETLTQFLPSAVQADPALQKQLIAACIDHATPPEILNAIKARLGQLTTPVLLSPDQEQSISKQLQKVTDQTQAFLPPKPLPSDPQLTPKLAAYETKRKAIQTILLNADKKLLGAIKADLQPHLDPSQTAQLDAFILNEMTMATTQLRNKYAQAIAGKSLSLDCVDSANRNDPTLRADLEKIWVDKGLQPAELLTAVTGRIEQALSIGASSPQTLSTENKTQLQAFIQTYPIVRLSDSQIDQLAEAKSPADLQKAAEDIVDTTRTAEIDRNESFFHFQKAIADTIKSFITEKAKLEKSVFERLANAGSSQTEKNEEDIAKEINAFLDKFHLQTSKQKTVSEKEILQILRSKNPPKTLNDILAALKIENIGDQVVDSLGGEKLLTATMQKDARFHLFLNLSSLSQKDKSAILSGLLLNMDQTVSLGTLSPEQSLFLEEIAVESKRSPAFFSALVQAVSQTFIPKTVHLLASFNPGLKETLLASMPPDLRRRYEGILPLMQEAQQLTASLRQEVIEMEPSDLADLKSGMRDGVSGSKFVLDEVRPQLMSPSHEKAYRILQFASLHESNFDHADTDLGPIDSDTAKAIVELVITNPPIVSLGSLTGLPHLLSKSPHLRSAIISAPLTAVQLSAFQERLTCCGLAADSGTRTAIRGFESELLTALKTMLDANPTNRDVADQYEKAQLALSVLGDQSLSSMQSAIDISKLSVRRALGTLIHSPNDQDFNILLHSVETVVQLAKDSPEKSAVLQRLQTIKRDSRSDLSQKMCQMHQLAEQVQRIAPNQLPALTQQISMALSAWGKIISEVPAGDNRLADFQQNFPGVRNGCDVLMVLMLNNPDSAAALLTSVSEPGLSDLKATLLQNLTANPFAPEAQIELRILMEIDRLLKPDLPVGAPPLPPSLPSALPGHLTPLKTTVLTAELDRLHALYLQGDMNDTDYASQKAKLLGLPIFSGIAVPDKPEQKGIESLFQAVRAQKGNYPGHIALLAAKKADPNYTQLMGAYIGFISHEERKSLLSVLLTASGESMPPNPDQTAVRTALLTRLIQTYPDLAVESIATEQNLSPFIKGVIAQSADIRTALTGYISKELNASSSQLDPDLSAQLLGIVPMDLPDSAFQKIIETASKRNLTDMLSSAVSDPIIFQKLVAGLFEKRPEVIDAFLTEKLVEKSRLEKQVTEIQAQLATMRVPDPTLTLDRKKGYIGGLIDQINASRTALLEQILSLQNPQLQFSAVVRQQLLGEFLLKDLFIETLPPTAGGIPLDQRAGVKLFKKMVQTDPNSALEWLQLMQSVPSALPGGVEERNPLMDQLLLRTLSDDDQSAYYAHLAKNPPETQAAYQLLHSRFPGLPQTGAELDIMRKSLLTALHPDELAAVLTINHDPELVRFIATKMPGSIPFQTMQAVYTKEPHLLLSMRLPAPSTPPTAFEAFVQLLPHSPYLLLKGMDYGVRTGIDLANSLNNISMYQPESYVNAMRLVLHHHADLLIKAYPHLTQAIQDDLKTNVGIIPQLTEVKISEPHRIELLSAMLGLQPTTVSLTPFSDSKPTIARIRDWILQHADDPAQLENFAKILSGMITDPATLFANSSHKPTISQLLTLTRMLQRGLDPTNQTIPNPNLDPILQDPIQLTAFMELMDLSRLPVSEKSLKQLTTIMSQIPNTETGRILRNCVALKGVAISAQLGPAVVLPIAGEIAPLFQTAFNRSITPTTPTMQIISAIKTKMNADVLAMQNSKNPMISRAYSHQIQSASKTLQVLNQVAAAENLGALDPAVGPSLGLSTQDITAINRAKDTSILPKEMDALNRGLLLSALDGRVPPLSLADAEQLIDPIITAHRDVFQTQNLTIDQLNQTLSADEKTALGVLRLPDPSALPTALRIRLINIRLLAALGVSAEKIPAQFLASPNPIIDPANPGSKIDIIRQAFPPNQLPAKLKKESGISPADQQKKDYEIEKGAVISLSQDTSSPFGAFDRVSPDSSYNELALTLAVPYLTKDLADGKDVDSQLNTIISLLKDIDQKDPGQFGPNLERVFLQMDRAATAGTLSTQSKLAIVRMKMKILHALSATGSCNALRAVRTAQKEIAENALLNPLTQLMKEVTDILPTEMDATSKSKRLVALAEFEKTLHALLAVSDGFATELIIGALQASRDADIQKLAVGFLFMGKVKSYSDLLMNDLTVQRPFESAETDALQLFSDKMSHDMSRMSKDERIIFATKFAKEINEQFKALMNKKEPFVSEVSLRIFLSKMDAFLSLTQSIAPELNGEVTSLCQTVMDSIFIASVNAGRLLIIPTDRQSINAFSRILSRSEMGFAKPDLLQTMIRQLGSSNFQIIVSQIQNPIVQKNVRSAMDRARKALLSPVSRRIDTHYQPVIQAIQHIDSDPYRVDQFLENSEIPEGDKLEVLRKALALYPKQFAELVKRLPEPIRNIFFLSFAGESGHSEQLMPLLATKEGKAVFMEFCRQAGTQLEDPSLKGGIFSDATLFFTKHAKLYGDPPPNFGQLLQGVFLQANAFQIKGLKREIIANIGWGSKGAGVTRIRIISSFITRAISGHDKLSLSFQIGLQKVAALAPQLVRDDEEMASQLLKETVEQSFHIPTLNLKKRVMRPELSTGFHGYSLSDGFKNILTSLLAGSDETQTDNIYKNIILPFLSKQSKSEKKQGKYSVAVKNEMIQWLAEKHPDKFVGLIRYVSSSAGSIKDKAMTPENLLLFAGRSMSIATRKKVLDAMLADSKLSADKKAAFSAALLVDADAISVGIGPATGSISKKGMAHIESLYKNEKLEAKVLLEIMMELEKILGKKKFQKTVLSESGPLGRLKAKISEEINHENAPLHQKIGVKQKEIQDRKQSIRTLTDELSQKRTALAAAPNDPAIASRVTELSTLITDAEGMLKTLTAEIATLREITPEMAERLSLLAEIQAKEMAEQPPAAVTSFLRQQLFETPAQFQAYTEKFIESYAKLNSLQKGVAVIQALFPPSLRQAVQPTDPKVLESSIDTALTPKDFKSLPVSLQVPDLQLKTLKPFVLDAESGITSKEKSAEILKSATEDVDLTGDTLMKSLRSFRLHLASTTYHHKLESWEKHSSEFFERIRERQELLHIIEFRPPQGM